MPCGIGETVEHVKNKWTRVALIRPVLLAVLIGLVLSPRAIVGRLEFITATPDDHDQSEKGDPGGLGTRCTTNALQVKRKTKDVCTNNLHDVVDNPIQGSSASVEIRAVDLTKVVGIEPVGGKEHGEQGQDIRVSEERFVETQDFGLPRWVLHDNDF